MKMLLTQKTLSLHLDLTRLGQDVYDDLTVIGCGNLQHRPFENQHQRMLTPKAQTRRSFRVAVYHFIFS